MLRAFFTKKIYHLWSFSNCLLTGGDIVLEDIRVEHLGSDMEKLREAGAALEILSLDRVLAFKLH